MSFGPFVIFDCKLLPSWGSGCGTVDDAVASGTSGPGLESNHRQLLLNTFTVNCL